jgi:DNA (cytosine-5)-methyltransferase 1
MRLTHGSLFSGIGGFDLAAEWMGWNNIFQVEKDDWCRKVLAKNFPKTERFVDIKNFTGHEYTSRIDVISGGFPCQPFSVAGQRRGKDDDRYLWEEMFRVIATIKPTYVVGENVTGIIGLALDTVLSDLEAQDYTTETFIIPACGKNAWHKRDRVWIVAYSNGIGRQDEQKENGKSICNGELDDAIEKCREQQQCRTGKSGFVFPDTEGIGCKQSGNTRNRWAGFENSNSDDGGIISNTNNTGCKEQLRSIADETQLFTPKCSSWWETEPGVGRVVDGLPDRVDRLKGLGNAIVPQVAYEIFKAIDKVETR